MFLKLVAAFFQDACRRSADVALWNGKRDIYFKESRLRYLATRGGMALTVRRCVTGISSELRNAAACMASRKAWYRDAQEKLHRPIESNNIDRVFRSVPCHHTEETPPTRLSAEGRSCITAKQCPCI